MGVGRHRVIAGEVPDLAPDAPTPDLPDRTSPAQRFLNARCLTIAGGTTEVQLNIIAERLLALPRDPEPVRPVKA